MRLTGFRIIGSSYQRGRLVPGATVLTGPNDARRYFNESVSLDAAINAAEESGDDVSELRALVQNWVKTGQGAKFNLI